MSGQALIAQPGGTLTAVAEGDTSKITYEGSITFTIAGQEYTLTGTLGNDFIMAYHATFAESISLGQVGTIAPQIADALGVPAIAEAITSAQKTISELPIVGTAAKVIMTSSLRITDIEINTASQTYQVGIALDFTTSDPKPEVAGITLLSLGFKVTSAKAVDPDDGG